MEQLDDGSIDAVITDPPFGITDCQWDDAPDLAAWWDVVKRKLSPTGIVAAFAAGRFTFLLYESNRKWYRYDLVWRKSRPVGFLWANHQPLRAHESILIFAPKLCAATYIAQKTGTPLRRAILREKIRTAHQCYGKCRGRYIEHIDGLRHPTSVLEFAHDPDRIHPTQKPLALMRWLVRSYTRPGDLVCDPFAGSGTTPLAAALEGRRYFAIERDPTIYRQACRRLAEQLAPAERRAA